MSLFLDKGEKKYRVGCSGKERKKGSEMLIIMKMKIMVLFFVKY